MRKMTKTAVTLAAMSAMTIASASLAFAAAQRDQLNAVENPAATSNPNSGKWEENADGWTFTPSDENKLKNTWAEIDGVWYYFHKDGIMAQDELVYLEGKTYYFTPNGAMAVGWYGFDWDSEVLDDYGLNIQENIDDIRNPVFENVADAYDTVWLYFDTNGVAKDDEWYHAENSGLWYRFDDIVMVCGDFDHELNGSYYGFDENGAMLVGWARNYNDLMKTAPNKDETAWYYYDSNGKKFDANRNNGYAWKQITDENGTNWYCFYASGQVGSQDSGYAGSVGTLIMNSYFSNEKTGTGDKNFYYVNNKGIMATGVVTVPKDAKYVDSAGWTTNDKGEVPEVGKKWDVYFGKDGTAQSDTWSGNRFYANKDSANVFNFKEDNSGTTTFVVSGYTEDANVRKIKGALVKSAFVYKSDNFYYVDKDGDKVTSSVVEVGSIDGITGDFSNTKAVSTTENNAVEYKAYVLLNAKGEVYTDVEPGREIRIGSKRYKATNHTLRTKDGDSITKDGDSIQIFYYENKN